MQHEWLEFGGKIAWPLVALIGVLILGPGGVLQKLVGELATNLFKITTSVDEFKKTASEIEKTMGKLDGSTQWLNDLQSQLASIATNLDNVRYDTQQLAVSEGSRSLRQAADNNPAAGIEIPTAEGLSTNEMFVDIQNRWNGLTGKLRDRLGAENFDARSIGQMAWRLVDRRRNPPLSKADAELIEQLHSQMKRFVRLRSTKDEWLTHEVYAPFVLGVDQALAAL